MLGDVAGVVPASRGAHRRPLHPRLASLCSGHELFIVSYSIITIGSRVATGARSSAQARRGGGCLGQDRERDPGCIPRSELAHRDAAGVNGSNRILFHGAPRLRMMPNRCLGSPVIVLLRS